MDNKEAKFATEIKFLNAVASSNFFYSIYSSSSGLCEKRHKMHGEKFPVLVISQKKHKISEKQWIIY